MKTLCTAEQAIGKTLKEIRVSGCLLCFTFTDDTFLLVNGESRQYDCELQLLATQDMALIVLGYDMQSFGIADIDEFREWQLTRKAKQRELQIAQKRAEYEKLKKEFGE